MNSEQKLNRAIDSFHQFIFESTATDINAWLNQAISLRTAATILQQHCFDNNLIALRNNVEEHLASDYESIQLMLTGYSLENYAKGLFVAQNLKIVENNQLTRIDHHDVKKILEDVQFDINDAEKEVLEKINRIVLWAGRYPVPKSLKEWQQNKKEKSISDSAIFIKNLDFETASKLMDRLELKLKNIIQSEDDSFKKTGFRIRVI